MRTSMKMKKLAAAVLAVLTACSLSACGGDTSWTFRSGDYTVTSGMYVGLSIDALSAASSTEGYDSTKSPFDQDIESTDSVKWLQAKANQLSKEYLAIETQFAERGLTLSEQDQSEIDSQVEMYWTQFGMGSVYEEEGCGKTSYATLVANNYKKNLLFQNVYGEGGEKEVPESELEATFQNDYVKGVYISLSILDDEGEKLTGDELQAVKDDAQKLADRIEAGEDFEEVKAQYLADPDAEEESEPTDTSIVTLKESATTAPYNAIASGEVGEVQVVEGTNAMFVVQTLDVMSGTSFDDYRDTVLQNMKADEFEDLITEWVSALEITENESAVSKHSPKHLKDLY